MAVRVRKLAKELRAQPDQVIAMLQQLGFSRYRRAEDMVPDGVAKRVRQEAVACRALPVPPMEPRPSPPKDAPQEPPSEGGWMDQLVPGVRPLDSRGAQPAAPPRQKPPAAPAASRPASASATVPAPEREEHVFEKDRLEAKAQELEEMRAQLEREREEWASELAQLREARRAPKRRSWRAMLDERGLKRPEEHQAAIAGLVSRGLMGFVLDEATVSETARFREVLASNLKLCGGDPPAGYEEDLVVRVTPDRGEIPTARQVAAWMRKISEGCLLRGWRRVVCVGEGSDWQRLLRQGLDARVELSLQEVKPPWDAEALASLGLQGAGVVVVGQELDGPITQALTDHSEGILILPASDPGEVVRSWVEAFAAQDRL